MCCSVYFVALLIFLPCPSDAFFSDFVTFVQRSYRNFHCKFVICCNDENVKLDFEGLQRSLEKRVHGQHLVSKAVLSHIRGHIKSVQPPKALVLSFHGNTGVGKNLVGRIIAEHLFKDGMNSPFVHLISGGKDFLHEDRVSLYKDQLQSWIQGNVSKCGKSMFIFDEVDKFPARLLDAVKPYADYHEHLGHIDYRRSIFLFLGNSGGLGITEKALEHWKSGKPREELKLREIENEIMVSAINSGHQNTNKKGLWHSQMISSHLITAFIPFLPLEKQHVRKCVSDSLAFNYFRNSKVRNKIIDNVLDELRFGPKDEQVFSITGCKRVAEKLDYVMMDMELQKTEL